MGHYIKVILGSLVLALIIVGINGVINYFFVSQSFNIVNVRSISLFIFVFLGSTLVIGKNIEQT